MVLREQLLVAAEDGDIDECRELIESVPHMGLVDYQNAGTGVCALHHAARRSPEDDPFVNALLELGADPHLRDFEGAQPRHTARRARNHVAYSSIVRRMNLFPMLKEHDELLKVECTVAAGV